MDGDFPTGDPEPETCVICKVTITTRRVDMGEPGLGDAGPFYPQPVCTDCLTPCEELGDDHCAGDPCVCQMPDAR